MTMINAYGSPQCHDLRECFAKTEYRKQKRCLILTITYAGDYACPFCKPKKEGRNPYDIHHNDRRREGNEAESVPDSAEVLED